MRHKRILYGVCGIGLGHTYRQLPIIEHLARENRIVIFAYGKSYAFYKKRFSRTTINVVKVAVPFYVSAKDGIDFAATAKRNRGIDFAGVNRRAISAAQRHLGTIDLVLSDYEPISAQYAYAKNIPLVTIDQQTKYLVGKFPPTIDGKNFADEVAKLRLFFPTATKRIVCSFFRFSTKRKDVVACPPILRKEILRLKRKPEQNRIFIYLSSQERIAQTPRAFLNALAKQDAHFSLYAEGYEWGKLPSNVHKPELSHFMDDLARCTGIISTAGHTLLSEAMHLGIPVYALTLDVYEQRMNAKIINDHGFGVAKPKLDATSLATFLTSIPDYKKQIAADKRVLLRGSGKQAVLKALRKL